MHTQDSWCLVNVSTVCLISLAGIYMPKINKETLGGETRFGTSSNIKTRTNDISSGDITINLEHIYYLFPVYLLLILSR